MTRKTLEDLEEIAELIVDDLSDKWTRNEPLPKNSMELIQHLRNEFKLDLLDSLHVLRDHMIRGHIYDLEVMGYKHYGDASLSLPNPPVYDAIKI